MRDEYRIEMDEIRREFGGKRLLTITEAAKYIGLDRRTVMKLFGLEKAGYIPVGRLCSLMTDGRARP